MKVALALLIASAAAFVPSSPTWTRASVQVNAVTAKDVKALREETSAGMMDCKKALTECDGDMEKAGEWLRAKGLASAAKKAGRSTSEGIIQTYIHTGGKLGVMVEVNCETDFVAKGEIFADLSRSIAMQIAASPNVEYVSEEDVRRRGRARDAARDAERGPR